MGEYQSTFSADAPTPNDAWIRRAKRGALVKRVILLVFVVFIFLIAFSEIKFPQGAATARSIAPVRVTVPPDVDRFLLALGDAYGTPDSAGVAQYLATDFLHQGMNASAFLHRLKTHQKYLGRLTISPVKFEKEGDFAVLAAIAESPSGVLAPSLQLLPLYAGGTIVKQGNVWKLRGNQQESELALYKRNASIFADFTPPDLQAYERLLPAGYRMPRTPYVRVTVVNWEEVEAPLEPYCAAQLSILVQKDDQELWYLLAMPETDWLEVEGGKTVGFPTFLADVDIRRSFSNQWRADVARSGQSVVSVNFGLELNRRIELPPNGDQWLIFGKDRAALKSVIQSLEPFRKAKSKYGWMTVNAYASPWKDLIHPGSRAMAVALDQWEGLKLHTYPEADLQTLPDGVPQLIAETSVAWASGNMDAVLQNFYAGFTFENHAEFAEMRRIFSFSRRYRWRVKDLRLDGDIAYIDGEIQTDIGSFPSHTRLIKDGGGWKFYGKGIHAGLKKRGSPRLFRDGGPDEIALGKHKGYPLGTPDNWWLDEGVRVGSYTNLEKIRTTRVLKKPPIPSDLKRLPVEPELQYNYQGRLRSVDDFLQSRRASGLLIISNGTILLERYQYDRKPTDKFVSNSMAKSVLSLAVGLALEEGKIGSLDDIAAKYVPELAGYPYGSITIRDALRMASGTKFTENYDGHDDLQRFIEIWRTSNLLEAFKAFGERETDPGKHFNYDSSLSYLLGVIVRRATGETLSDYVAEKIWRPMGAEADASWQVDDQGVERAAGSFSAVLRDYGRLGVLLANDGALNGKQILPKAYLLEATDWHMHPPSFAPRRATSYFGYGYQFWLLPGEERRFVMIGAYGQMIYVDPATKLVMVQTGVTKNAVEFGEGSMGSESIRLWFSLLANAPPARNATADAQ